MLLNIASARTKPSKEQLAAVYKYSKLSLGMDLCEFRERCIRVYGKLPEQMTRKQVSLFITRLHRGVF